QGKRGQTAFQYEVPPLYNALIGDCGVRTSDNRNARGHVMKISGLGAAVGAVVGCLARGAVVLLTMGEVNHLTLILSLPSTVMGLLVGAIAGAVGRPLLGALIGAVLSGIVFEMFMFACASVVRQISPQSADGFLSQTLIYGLEMTAAGALAGGVG